jgi:hypothetical protein
MFRSVTSPSSGRHVTKNKNTEMLKMSVSQCTRKILDTKITWFKIRITV